MSDRLEQEAADRLLREAFRGVARPAPSLHFERRLNAALEEERRRRRFARRTARLMHAYWLAAGMASFLILISLPWFESPGGASLALAITASIVVLPALFLHVNLLDLIACTFGRSGELPGADPEPLDYPPCSPSN